MPFIKINIQAGHSEAARKRMASGIAEVVRRETGLPDDAIWIVFREVASADWFIGSEALEPLEPARADPAGSGS